MPLRAVIDVGTNSVKLLVAELREGRIEKVRERTDVTRLGEGLGGSGSIDEAAAARTIEAVCAMAGEARALGAEGPVVVGTMALRIAKNAEEFRRRAADASGLAIEVLSEEEEARLSYRAAISAGRARGPIAVFDIGGGSLELIRGTGRKIESARSYPLGVRLLTEKFLRSDPVRPEMLRELIVYVESYLDGLPRASAPLAGVGGTATTIASVQIRAARYDPDRIDGTVVPLEEVGRQIELFASLGVRERRSVPGLLPERADVILAGVAVVRVVLEKSGASSFRATGRGLRHGVLLDRWGDPGVRT